MPGFSINGSSYGDGSCCYSKPKPSFSSRLGLYVAASVRDSYGLGGRFLLSNNEEEEEEEQVQVTEEEEEDEEGKDEGLELYYSSDEFRMYEFKIRGCLRGKSHDWTECPYAHPGEKAKRRDPRRVRYTGTACPDFRKGCCKRGEACDLAHGVFECWLHPSRYRTELCKDGPHCTRPVCFFAHTFSQLRTGTTCSPSASSGSLSSSPTLSSLLSSQFSLHNVSPSSPPSYDGSPLQHAMSGHFNSHSHSHSPPSSPPFHRQSFPLSPRSPLPPPISSTELLSRHLGHMHIGPAPVNESLQFPLPPSLCHFPSPLRSGRKAGEEDEEEVEKSFVRVESGRELRAKIYGKLRKDNPLDSSDPNLDWVNDLIN